MKQEKADNKAAAKKATADAKAATKKEKDDKKAANKKEREDNVAAQAGAKGCDKTKPMKAKSVQNLDQMAYRKVKKRPASAVAASARKKGRPLLPAPADETPVPYNCGVVYNTKSMPSFRVIRTKGD